MKNLVLSVALLAASAGAAAEDWTWYEKDALQVKGRAFADGATYYSRLPARVKDLVRPQVWEMSRHSTGMFIRFRTDAAKIRLEWKVANEGVKDALIPPAGLLGIDVYNRTSAGWNHKGNNRYATTKWVYSEKEKKFNADNKYGRAEIAWTPGEEGMLLLPIRAEVTELRVGVPVGAKFEPVGFPKGREKPVVHYGTSIVHGGCASRAGLTFTAIAQRLLDRDYVNLGFSGNGQLDLELVPFLAEIDAAVYLVDCAWNVDPDKVRQRCAKFLKELHRLKPDTPIILCEGCNSTTTRLPVNDAIRKVYDELVKEDPTVCRWLRYFPEEEMLVRGDHEQTHDFCHPNDLGTTVMGPAYAKHIAAALAAGVK